MATVDFSRYLDVAVEDIEQAKPLPAGHYFAVIKGWKPAERDYKDGNPKVPVVELTFTTTSPDEDVDPDELPNNQGVGVMCTKDYRLATPSGGKVEGGGQAQLRRLAEDQLGLSVAGMHLTDVLEAMKGQECRVYNEPRADKKDEGVFYTNITKVLGVN